MDRRSFLKRSALVGGLAAAALAGPGMGVALADDGDAADETGEGEVRRRRFRLRGRISELAEDSTSIRLQDRWIIVDEQVNPELEVSGELEIGAFALVQGWIETDGEQPRLIAQRVRVQSQHDLRRPFRTVGTVERWEPDDGMLVINAREIRIDADVVPVEYIAPDLSVGDWAFVAGWVVDGTTYAAVVRTRSDDPPPDGERFHLRGRLEQVADHHIMVDEQPILIRERTEIRGELEVGRIAGVWGIQPPEGDPVALRILVLPERGDHPPSRVPAGRSHAPGQA